MKEVKRCLSEIETKEIFHTLNNMHLPHALHRVRKRFIYDFLALCSGMRSLIMLDYAFFPDNILSPFLTKLQTYFSVAKCLHIFKYETCYYLAHGSNLLDDLHVSTSHASSCRSDFPSFENSKLCFVVIDDSFPRLANELENVHIRMQFKKIVEFLEFSLKTKGIQADSEGRRKHAEDGEGKKSSMGDPPLPPLFPPQLHHQNRHQNNNANNNNNKDDVYNLGDEWKLVKKKKNKNRVEERTNAVTRTAITEMNMQKTKMENVMNEEKVNQMQNSAHSHTHGHGYAHAQEQIHGYSNIGIISIINLKPWIDSLDIALPTVNGFLLNYPVVYVVKNKIISSFSSSTPPSSSLSSSSLNVFRIEMKSALIECIDELDLKNGNENNLLSFSIPSALSPSAEKEAWAIKFMEKIVQKYHNCCNKKWWSCPKLAVTLHPFQNIVL